MRQDGEVHRRYLWAPLVCGISALAMGTTSYMFALTLTDNRHTALGWLLTMDGALTLYLIACYASTEEREGEDVRQQ